MVTDGSCMKQNKCIVFLTPGFTEDESNTSTIPALQDFFNAWRRNYPEEKIFILSFQFPLKRGWHKWNGIDVYSAAGKNRKGISRFICWVRILIQLFKIKRNYSLGKIFCFWFTEAAFIAQLFSMIKKVKLYCYLFGRDVTSDNSYLKLLSSKRFFLIANSSFTAKTFYNTTGITVGQTVPLGIDLTLLPQKLLPLKYDIIGAGSLNKTKNYELFLEVIYELVKKNTSLKVLIAGGGTEHEFLNSNISELSLQSHVNITGEISREKTLQYMSESAVLLHTAPFESFSMVRVEAFSLGCTVLTFNNGYIINDSEFKVFNSKEEIIAWLKAASFQSILREKRPVRSMDDCVKEVYGILHR